MKTSVERLVVFALTPFAHLKSAHRRLRTVVWNVFDDGETRSAIRAVNKRITKSAVAFVEKFAPTFGANTRVGRDERVFRLTNLASDNAKISIISESDFFNCNRGDYSERRRIFAQETLESDQIFLRAFNFDEHAAAGIADESAQITTLGAGVNKRSKADTLHRAANRQTQSLKIAVFFSLWNHYLSAVLIVAAQAMPPK